MVLQLPKRLLFTISKIRGQIGFSPNWIGQFFPKKLFFKVSLKIDLLQNYFQEWTSNTSRQRHISSSLQHDADASGGAVF